MLKIGLTGWYGKKNLGDELLRQNLQVFYGLHKVIVLEPKEIVDADIDVLIFGGGGILHDLYVKGYYPKKLLEKVDCPILMLGVGIPYGNKKTVISHKIDYFINRIDFFGFRDPVSKRIFDNRWNKPSKIIPDLGYLTTKKNCKRKNKASLQIRQVLKSYRELSPRKFNKIAKKQFKLLYSYLTKSDYDTSFLLFHPSDIKMVPKQANYVDCCSDVEKAINQIASSKICIGSKLHFNIIALTQFTPFTAYYYIGKIEGVLSYTINSNRIVYPKKIFPSKLLIPNELSDDESMKLRVTQSYLRSSLRQLIKGDYNLPKFPLYSPKDDVYVETKIHEAPKLLKNGKEFFKKIRSHL